jgi:hypothetical protein
MRAVFFKELSPERRDGDECPAVLVGARFDETTIVGILPDGEARA